VGQPYLDAISFHVTTACSPASLFDPTLTSASVRITQMSDFTFTNLPQGLSGVTNQPSYTPPANGCGSISGVPTEAGVFAATVNILVDVNAWPFSLTCGGIGPIAQNDVAISEARELVILPDPAFTAPAAPLCLTDAAVTLVPTGTTGGTFSGPGVVGNVFDPAIAGPGVHSVKYVVSAQQGAAIAPATDSLEVAITVTDCSVVCDAFAGTLTRVGPEQRCREVPGTTIEATPNGDAVVPPGYVLRYVFTNGLTPVVQAFLDEPSVTFTDPFTAVQLTPFVYDPSTLDLSFVQIGLTSLIDIQFLIAEQNVCASLDFEASWVLFGIEDCCNADAGTLGGLDLIPCLEPGSFVELVGIPGGDAVLPDGFSLAYVLTQGPDLVIQSAGPDPAFQVNVLGLHTLHTLVYDPATFDPGTINWGTTTGAEVSALFVQGSGSICASLDMVGASYTVIECAPPCDADAGTLTPDAGTYCLDPVNGTAVVSATSGGNTVVPDGYGVGYLLAQGPELVIVGLNGTPVFTASEAGTYSIHTMVYDPQTVDPTLIDLGVTTAADLNALLIQGGGEFCGSLDLVGAAFTVEACTGIPALLTGSLAVFPNPTNGDFRLRLPASGAAQLELLDLSGRVVFRAGRSVAADGVVDLLLSGVVAAGTYVLRATVAEGRWEQRVVVQQ
jgi:hypothetical protein